MQISTTFVSKMLTDVSLKYTNSPNDFICDLIAPIVKVKQKAGKIFSYGMENLRIVNTYRSVGGKANVVETTVSASDLYSIEDHCLVEYIAKELYDNADKPIDPQIDVTEALTERIYLDREKSLADVLSSSTYITQYTTLSGTSQWSDYLNSTPTNDIDTGISAVRAGCGKVPNTMILSWDALQKLRFHPEIIGFFPGAPKITSQMVTDSVSAIFGIERLLVGKAVYNNSNKGGTDTLADIWSKVCIIAYIDPTPRVKSMTLANTYQVGVPRSVDFTPWTNDSELKLKKSDMVMVSDEYDQVLVNANCAYLIKTCIA